MASWIEIYRSEMRMCSPLASCSSVSSRGIVWPDAMRATVDLGIPVMISTCRAVR